MAPAMKFRCLFVNDKKQAAIPEGWEIHRVDIVTPPKGKPQFMILMTQAKEEEKKPIGFKK